MESVHNIPNIDVAELLDTGRWSRYQKLVTVLVAIAVVFDGFDIQVLGFAIPSLIRDWHAARGEFGVVLAAGLVGMVVGAPLSGYAGDRFGRRPAVIGCVVVFGLSTFATAFVRGFIGLTILRLITGIGMGGAFPNVSALSAELAPVHRRSTAVNLTLICIPIGGILAGILAAWVLPRFGWRGLYVIAGIFPLLFAAALAAILPESPRFMARRPRDWSRLRALLNRMGHQPPKGVAFVDRAESRDANRASLKALFAPGLARETVGLWIAFFFCIGNIYLVFGWLPTMLTSHGLDLASASSGLAVYNFGGVFGILIWAMLIPILGSRGPIVSGALACAASALALIIVPIQANASSTLLIACLGLNGMLAHAIQTSTYALASHVYPTSIRATGIAYSAAIGRTGGLLTSVFGSYFIELGPHSYWLAIAVAMLCAAGGLAWVRSHYPAIRGYTARG